MSLADIAALLPIIVIAAASVIVMIIIAFYRSHKLTVILTLSGLAVSFAMLLAEASLLSWLFEPQPVKEDAAKIGKEPPAR